MWPLRPAEAAVALLQVIPSPWDTDPIRRATGLFRGLSGLNGCSLEFVASTDGIRFYVRAKDHPTLFEVRAQLRAAYPQAQFREVPMAANPALDPACRTDTEAIEMAEITLRRSWTHPLASKWRDGDDPLISVLTAAGQLAPGERVLCQMAVGRAPEGWSDQVPATGEPVAASARDTSPSSSADLVPMVALFALGAAVFQAYLWIQEGHGLRVAAAAAAGLPLLALAAAILARWQSRGPGMTRQTASEKLSEPALTTQLRVLAFGRDGTTKQRLRAIALRVIASYQAFDYPAGNSFRPASWSGDPSRPSVQTSWFRSPAVLNAAELAGLWHLPCDAVGFLSPAGVSRRLLPDAEEVARGCPVGVSSHQGMDVAVHMPQSLLFRHQLVVAKTRRGKSTLLLHMAAHLGEVMASGRERLSMVVVDPHQDLAEAILGSLPDRLADRVVYLNLANRDRPIGLNLLDVGLFPDRDRTAENVVTMMHRLWPDNWGPRMEGALRACVACLHQANQIRAREEQYTLLDVVPMLANGDFREEVLKQVPDPSLWAWWRDNYERISRTFQQQTANPVTTKVGRFVVNEGVRLLVGQPCSTIDPRALLRDGGVLVVNTAVGVLGEGAAALVGATILNLMGLVVEEQVVLPQAERRRIVALVDESSTLAAADYPRMLSELAKYGASFVLVTQSLARLESIDRALRPTVLSNVDGLTVFQVSAEDARFLAPELGSGLEVADMTSLDDFECYARWWSSGRRLPAFSLRLRPPAPASADRAAQLAQRSAGRFGRPRADVAGAIERVLVDRGGGVSLPGAEVSTEEDAGEGDEAEEQPQPTRRSDPKIPRRSQHRDSRRRRR